MRTSDRGIIALISHEGIVPAPYYDSKGILTYGIGHTKAAGDPNPAKMARGMPDDLDAALVRVFEVFRRDLRKYEDGVRRAFKVPLSQHEFDAAVSFHYNTGAIGRARWVKLFNKGHREKAIASIMNWCKPAEIIPRRKDEQHLFAEGVYPKQRLEIWRVDRAGNVIWSNPKTISPFDALRLMGGRVPDEVTYPQKRHTGGIAAAIVALIVGAWAAFSGWLCGLPLISTLCGG